MLNILLVILKTAGILSALLIFLILLVLLTVLLVPVRYSISGEYAEQCRPKADVNISWLQRLLKAHIGYDGALSYDIRIFGRCIESSERPRTEPPEPMKTEPPEPTKTESPESAKAEPAHQEAAGNKPAAAEKADKPETDRSETGKTEPDKPGTDKSDNDRLESGKEPYEGNGHDAVPRPDETNAEPEPHTAGGTHPAQGRIRRALGRLLDRIRRLIIRLWGFIKRIRENKDGVRAFFADSGNKRALTLLWSSTRKMLSHIWPRMLDGHLTFGFDDPAVTGYALAALSMLPGGDGTDMTVTPVFDRKYLDCAGRLQGRVRLAVPAGIVLKIYFDKDCRKLYSEVANGGK